MRSGVIIIINLGLASPNKLGEKWLKTNTWFDTEPLCGGVTRLDQWWWYLAWLQTTQQLAGQPCYQFVLFIIDRIKEGQNIYKNYFLISSAILKLWDLSSFGTKLLLSGSVSLFIFWDEMRIFLNFNSSVSPTSISSSSSARSLLTWSLGEQVGLWGKVSSLSAISSNCLGLISVWVCRWVFRLERWLKLRWHIGHLCGDSS